MLDISYVRRVCEVAVRNPVEFCDRVRGRFEVLRESRLPRPPLTSETPLIQGLLALLGGPLSDPYEEEFREVWTDIENAFADGGHAVGSGYDGGVSLARAAYTAVRHLKPDSVVETGVARGVTSRVVLEALKQNGVGHLWSIDLPPLAVGWQASSALCVTSDLR